MPRERRDDGGGQRQVHAEEHRDGAGVRLVQVRGHEARREGQQRDEQEQDEVEAHPQRVHSADEPGGGAVGDPGPADEGEADEVAEVGRPFIEQGGAERGVHRRHVQLEDEQGDGDGEDPVGERLQPALGRPAAGCRAQAATGAGGHGRRSFRGRPTVPVAARHSAFTVLVAVEATSPSCTVIRSLRLRR